MASGFCFFTARSRRAAHPGGPHKQLANLFSIGASVRHTAAPTVPDSLAGTVRD